MGTPGLDVHVRRRESGAVLEGESAVRQRQPQRRAVARDQSRHRASITKHNLVLATGHVSPPEALLLLREGRRQRTEHMVVTHAMNPPVSMDVAQMQEAAKQGAFIEFVGGSLTAGDANARLDRYADAIRKVGPQFCILSSDLGQKNNALPVDGYAAFLQAMRARGFSEHDVNVMSKDNPAKLLGLR